MTCVNAVTFFESNDFYELVEEMFDEQEDHFRNVVAKRLESADTEDHMDAFRMVRELEGGVIDPWEMLEKFNKSKNNGSGLNRLGKGF
jgi:hypothetical protein